MLWTADAPAARVIRVALLLAPIPPAHPDSLLQPDVAHAQDGVFTRSQARLEGWSDARQRRLLRSGLWVPITGSVLCHREVEVGPWQRARAVWLEGGRVPSHETAAALWRLKVVGRLHGISTSGRSVVGITDHRMHLAPDDLVIVRGMQVTSFLRTLTDLLCALPVEGSVDWITDGLRRGLVDLDQLTRAAERAGRRPGARTARRVVRSCAGRPYSFLEWRFQQLAPDVPGEWAFNVEVGDESGAIGIVDGLHVPSRTIVELDGRKFHGADRFQSDRSRDQRLTAAGYVVLRFTWDDVLNRPDHVREVIRRVVAQRMRLAA